MRSAAAIRLFLPFIAVLLVGADDTEKGTQTTKDTAAKTDEDAAVPGKCCYTGPSDCDSPSDWCSKNQAQCAACTGQFHPESGKKDSDKKESGKKSSGASASSVDLAAAPSASMGKCCYYKGCAGSDCDGPFDACSKSEGHCGSCSGSFCPLSQKDLEKVAKREAAKEEKQKKKAEKELEKEDKEDKKKKGGGPSNDHTLILAITKTSTSKAVAGKCCYYKGCDGTDCDDSTNSCSKDEGQCKGCGGSFCPLADETHDDSKDAKDSKTPTDDKKKQVDHNHPKLQQPLILAASTAEKNTTESGPAKCCYYKGCDGSDCDSHSDWCSTSEGHCKACVGSFCPIHKKESKKGEHHEQKKTKDAASSPTINLAAAEAPSPAPQSPKEVLEAKLASEDLHKCCYYRGCAGTDCDGPSDDCSKSAGHCKSCSGHFCPVTKADLSKLAERVIAKKKKEEEKKQKEELKKKEEHAEKLAKEKVEAADEKDANAFKAHKPITPMTLEEMKAAATSSEPPLAAIALTALFFISLFAMSLSSGFRQRIAVAWVLLRHSDEQSPGGVSREHLLA